MGTQILLGLCSLLVLTLSPAHPPRPSVPQVELMVVNNAPGDRADRYLAWAAVTPAVRAVQGGGRPSGVVRRLRDEDPAIRRRLDRMLAAAGDSYRAHIVVKAVTVRHHRIPVMVVRLGRGRGAVWTGALKPFGSRPASGTSLVVNWRLPSLVRRLLRLV
jgi:hypothetical protein